MGSIVTMLPPPKMFVNILIHTSTIKPADNLQWLCHVNSINKKQQLTLLFFRGGRQRSRTSDLHNVNVTL